MPLLIQRAQVAAKIETTEGTAETLGAADAILVENASFEPTIEMHEYDPMRRTLSPMPDIPGKRSARLTFTVPLKGSGTAGTAPEYGDLFKACGMAETVVAGTSVTYDPASESIPSMTLALYLDGKVYKIWGARGTFKLACAVGEPIGAEFEFQGADFSETAGSLLSGASYGSPVPKPFQNASFSISGYSAVIEKLEADMANNLYLRTACGATSGHVSCLILNRRPTVSFDPENVLVATEDFLGDWRAAATGALSAVVDGGAGNKVTISAPAVQYTDIKPGDRGGLAILEITGLLTMDSGDDELQIKFE